MSDDEHPRPFICEVPPPPPAPWLDPAFFGLVFVRNKIACDKVIYGCFSLKFHLYVESSVYMCRPESVIQYFTARGLPCSLESIGFHGIECNLAVISTNHINMTIHLHGSMLASSGQHVWHIMPLLLADVITLS